MPSPRATIDPSKSDHASGGSSERGSSARPGAPALWIGGAVAAVIGTLLVLAGARAFGPRTPESQIRRFAIPVPRLVADRNDPPRISPDGRYLLYSSGNRLMVRDLEQFEPTDVAGSEGARSFFWSHDSRRIGYFKDGKLWTSVPAGAQATLVCDIPGGVEINNADWGPDNSIVFAQQLEGLYVVSATGGAPRLLLQLDSTEVEFGHPQFLPDGRHIVAVAYRKNGLNVAIAISYPEGSRKNLGEFEQLVAVRFSPSGHLLLTVEQGAGEVRIAPFSVARLKIMGPPLLVLAGALYPSVSRDGALVYHRGSSRARVESAGVDPHVAGDPANQILLVQNWAEELKKPAAGK